MEDSLLQKIQAKQDEIDALKEENSMLKVAARATAQELIKQETMSAEDVETLVPMYPKWEVGISVKVGNLYGHLGTLYEVLQAHTTQADWTPDATPALWKSKAPAGVIPDFVQPTGAHDAYNIGDRVLFEGVVYESTIDGNVWSPTAYPQGWQVI